MSGEERALAHKRILAVAEKLSAVREYLVFIGGTVLPLLVDVDRRFYSPRMTDDVDAVGIAADYDASHKVELAVMEAGYRPDPKSKHKGRWIGRDNEIFDLSFAGDFPGASGARIDEMAIATAQPMDGHPQVRHLSPTGLFLMKCAAYQDRGRKRPDDSKDLADLAVLLVGARRALAIHFNERYPVPPDTPEELAEEALSVLTRLAQ